MFVDNLAAFTETLGVENAPTIMYLSMVPWGTASNRNAFIRALTNVDLRETSG